MIAHINIGSNIGNRLARIEQAVACICLCWEGRVRVSRVVESEPWGYVSDSNFLNVGVAVDVGRESPLDVFHKLQTIERSICGDAHRDAMGGYVDRVIDVDFIAMGDVTVSTPELTLPHPHMHEREFVLRPMAELDPCWTHPVLGFTAGALLSRLT